GYCCWAGELCANICPLGKLLQVKEQCYTGINCVSGSLSPSPSPWNKWPNGENACVDSIIRAEFSVPVLQSVLTALNIEIKKCASEECISAENVIGAFSYEIIAGSDPATCMGFSFIPAGLEKSSWYRVSLKGSAIKSADGKFLDGDKNGEPGGDYVWKFKTRDSAAPCEVGCPLVLPNKYSAENKSKIKYEGSFTAKDNKCVILSGKDKIWSWSSDSIKAAIYPLRDCCGDCDKNKTNWACILPKEETNIEKINITGEVKKGSQSEHSSGELTIDFEDFKVAEIWPSAGCDSACLNSAVAARFSNEIDFSTANKNNLKLYKCDDEKYLTCNEIFSGGMWFLDTGLILNNYLVELSPNSYYREVIKGGIQGLRNTSGGVLTGLNYATIPNGAKDSYSWTFKTANKECAVNAVKVDPQEAYVTHIGDGEKYWANPFSTPDKCGSSGQLLNGLSYNWAWSKGATNSGIAKISTDDPGKPYKSVIAIDGPTAPENQATVKIIAAETISGVIGSGNFTIVCGYEYGNPAHDAVCGAGKAVAQNGCCYDRPHVVEISPEVKNNEINNFCLNGLIKVKFDQLMDDDFLKSAKIFKKYSDGSQCAKTLSMDKIKGAVAGAIRTGDQQNMDSGRFMDAPKFLLDEFISIPFLNINNYFSADMTLRGAGIIKYGIDKMLAIAKRIFNTAAASGNELCNVEYSTILSTALWNGKTVTEIIIKPDNLLAAHNKNIAFDYQLDFNGLLNKKMIAVKDSPLINIKTGTEICEIDHIDVVIDNTSEGESATDDIFICAGRNNCGENSEIIKDDDDSNSMDGNQHLYKSFALDGHKNLLNAQGYVWNEIDPNVSQVFPFGAVRMDG
ncbi:MAG: hypothetical protein V1860_03410, partial [bacterium]